MTLIGLGLASVVMPACEAEVDTVPEGALARVGEVVIEAEQVESSYAQLDAFGQARFRGPHGRRALVDTIIEQELLVQEARDVGYGDDPRVTWAVYEELAHLQRTAMLERRLPRADVAADTQALRARYEREIARFMQPERRRLRVIRVDTWEQGERGIARIASGELSLAEFAEEIATPAQPRPLASTPSMKRDDSEFPAFHSIAFDPALKQGDLLPSPVLSGQIVLIGEIEELEPALPLPFEDPQVQEQLVSAERSARLEPLHAELDAELQARFAEL